MAHIILASSSPRRKELLQQLGLDFEIYSPDIDESVRESEIVEHYVERLARDKAHAVLGLYPDAIVIAADTSLSCAERSLESQSQSSMPLKSGQHFLDSGMMSTLEFVWQAARKS